MASHPGGTGDESTHECIVRRDLNGAVCGLNREVAGGHALFHDVAFEDANALEDPVVGRVDHPFEVGVGEKAGWHVSAESADFGANRFRQLELLRMKGVFCRIAARKSN